MSYYVYILSCADGTYYTGITTDIVRRLKEHNGGSLGAKYTRNRRPVSLLYQEEQPDRSSAQKREHMLRKLNHAQKKALGDEKPGKI